MNTPTRTFKTPKGTELPMLDLKGKPYLQVAHRVAWFREEHPDWTIETEQLTIDDTRAIFTARIKDGERLIAMATGHETKGDFADFIEKAETKAIGRALALCGYGTQFAPELDEGQRLADTPIEPAKRPKPFTLPPRNSPGGVKDTRTLNDKIKTWPPKRPAEKQVTPEEGLAEDLSPEDMAKLP